MQIPVHYNPRWYQEEALGALDSGITMSFWCWARRGGKDMTAFNYGVKKSAKDPMNVVLVWPTKKQGYDNFWTNIENDGFKTLDHIPKNLVASRSNNPENMKVGLRNGSTISLLGSTDENALRGANGKLYILSEFVDIDSSILDVIRPIVAVNGGQIIVQSTPKIDGISGGTFKIMFDAAKKNPKQFASLVTAREYLDEETLEELRQETIIKNGNDFKWRQEYLCDWGQSSANTYYGQNLKLMEANGRIGHHPHNPAYPVYTVWDLGTSETSTSTAITFFQYYNRRVHIIDYYETHNIGNKAIVKYLRSKPYNYGWHFLPHDAHNKDSDAVARIERLRDLGLINSSVLQREAVEDGIKQAAAKLPTTRIHRPTTTTLVRKLYLYKRLFNALTGDYLGPEKKTKSHAADTIRYLFMAIEQEFDPVTCEMYQSQDTETTYESDLPTTNFYQPNPQ